MVGPISWAGYCLDCGTAVRTQHNIELHYHRGPAFAYWRHRMAASVGAILLDDLEETP